MRKPRQRPPERRQLLLSTTPMGGDPDSAMFSAALNACGASYLGVVAEHASQRGLFAG